MIEKKDWIEFFPYKKPREEQEVAINFILNSFINKKKRFVLGEFPLGIGKSGIAITVCNYLKHKTLQKSYILTTQKILQEQYVRDFPNVASISAKNNYQCENHLTGINCTIGQLFAKKTLDDDSLKSYLNNCVYNQEKIKFQKSNISLTNLHYFIIHKNLDLEGRKILVIDECHNLENAITDFASITVDKYYVENVLKIEFPINNKTTTKSFIDWIKTDYVSALTDLYMNLENKFNRISDDIEYLKSHDNLVLFKKIEELKTKIDTLSSQTLKYLNEHDWVLTINETQDIANIKPLFASKYTERLLFEGFNYILLLSGTILDKDIFCRNVGINPDDADFKSLESPFEIKNRPIYEIPIGSMGRKEIDNTLPNMVSAIKEILNHHKSEKGIIHAHNYKIAKYITDNINDKRLLSHTSMDRDDTLNFHLISDEPTVIISPSFTEGIDLYGDKSRFQIIVKVPFPYIGDNYVKIKMEKVDGWYAWQTIKTIIQATGRSVRDYNDYATTYILDSDWIFLKNKNLHMIPKWFLKAIKK